MQSNNKPNVLKDILSARSKRKEVEVTQVEGQITLQDWIEWKEDIRNRLQETTENFVIIGYRLKQIRDSKIYVEGGYGSISEFALKEYGITKDVVSRFIRINDRYSIGGNSMELLSEYRNYGYSKLQEMLGLAEEECTEITETTTVQEIRQIKAEKKSRDEEKGAGEGEQNHEQETVYEDKVAAGLIKVATSQPDANDDWKVKKKKPENRPVELPPVEATYKEKMGATMMSEITSGSRRYIIVRLKRKYRVGNTLILQEHKDNKQTGRFVKFKVAHMTDDSGGLNPGYAVLGFLEYEEGMEEVDK